MRVSSWLQTAVHMRTDCLSLVKMVHSLRSTPMEHRLSAEVDAIREALVEEEIQSFEPIPGHLNASDGLTKMDRKLKLPLILAMRGVLQLPGDDPLRTGRFRRKPVEFW